VASPRAQAEQLKRLASAVNGFMPAIPEAVRPFFQEYTFEKLDQERDVIFIFHSKNR
jgi:hypothetical protein